MKTIRRNAIRKIAAIRDAVTRGEIYSETHDFIAQPIVNMDFVWDQYTGHDFQRLIDKENGTYVIEVHSNLWYVLHTAPKPEAAPVAVEEPPVPAIPAVSAAPGAPVPALPAPPALTVWSVEMEPTMGLMGIWATPELAKAAAERHARQTLNWYAAPKGEFRALHDERNPQHCPVWSVAPHIVRDSVEREG